MSLLYYFASDIALNEQPNPYSNQRVYYISSDKTLDAKMNYKYNYPNIIFIDKDWYCNDIGTSKNFCTGLEWSYSDDTLHVILDYIKEHMEIASELELWNVQLDDVEISKYGKRRVCKLNNLTAERLKAFFDIGTKVKRKSVYSDISSECLRIIK